MARRKALSILRRLRLMVLVISVMMAMPVMAQIMTVPDTTLDPEADPNPFDPRRAISEWLRTRLPNQWWMTGPEGTLNTFQVLIHIPSEWQGNPVSAVMAMCPEHNDQLWSVLNTLELQPFYQGRRWPGVICRP